MQLFRPCPQEANIYIYIIYIYIYTYPHMYYIWISIHAHETDTGLGQMWNQWQPLWEWTSNLLTHPHICFTIGRQLFSKTVILAQKKNRKKTARSRYTRNGWVAKTLASLSWPLKARSVHHNKPVDNQEIAIRCSLGSNSPCVNTPDMAIWWPQNPGG